MYYNCFDKSSSLKLSGLVSSTQWEDFQQRLFKRENNYKRDNKDNEKKTIAKTKDNLMAKGKGVAQGERGREGQTATQRLRLLVCNQIRLKIPYT